MTNTTTIKVDEVIWRDDLYPRFKPNQQRVEEYALSVEGLPPIEVNQKNELIDGFHRWSAHKLAGVAEIAATVTPTENEDEFLRLSIERNAKHGLQLSQDEKKSLAQQFYRRSVERDEALLAALFAVGVSTVRKWLADIKRDEAEQSKQTARELWLNCYDVKEAAESIGVDAATITRWASDFCNLSNWPNRKNLAEFTETDADGAPAFAPPIDDVWYWPKSSDDTGHFGKSNSEIVDRLLWLYTKPFDIVVDPFAGSGSTGAVANRRLRRAWMADRKPKPGSVHIRNHDVHDGPPSYLRWSDVALVYLDPPYWKQAENQYSTDAADLGNVELDQFYDVLTPLIRETAGKMKAGSHIALIIQPTMWNAPDRVVVDHVVDLILKVGNRKLKYRRRFSCPYPSQQHLPQMVTWAKEHRNPLVRNRELIVWQVQ